MAAARLVAEGERVLVVGGPGIVQAVGAGRATVVEEGPADAVVVGFTRDFDFAALHRAQSAILGGARLIGTNDDATYPTPDGPIPGGGALLAAVAKASGDDRSSPASPTSRWPRWCTPRSGRWVRAR